VITSVEVHWPSGVKERFAAPPIDQIVSLIEGKGQRF
jgi:hypothetical protein